MGQRLEEDLMSDRILSRIKKEAVRASREATLKYVKEQVKQHQQWQGLAQDQAVAVAT